MEPKLFGIFLLKMVAKNKVLESTRTHFVDMRVNLKKCFKERLLFWLLWTY